MGNVYGVRTQQFFDLNDTASIEILPYDRSRRYTLIQNLSKNRGVWVKHAQPVVVDESLFIEPGGYYEPPIPSIDPIFARADSGAARIFIIDY